MKEHETSPMLISRQELYKMLNCGRYTGDKVARAAGAERQYGRRVLIFVPAIEKFLASGQSVE